HSRLLRCSMKRSVAFGLCALMLLAFAPLGESGGKKPGTDMRVALTPIWPGAAPGAKGGEPADNPGVYIYPAKKPNGAATDVSSAGGQLSSTAGTHFDLGNKDAGDPVDRESCRPDFMVLMYPVITLTGPFAHVGSRNNLLGKTPDAKLVESLCNDKQVTKDTP